MAYGLEMCIVFLSRHQQEGEVCHRRRYEGLLQHGPKQWHPQPEETAGQGETAHVQCHALCS